MTIVVKQCKISLNYMADEFGPVWFDFFFKSIF